MSIKKKLGKMFPKTKKKYFLTKKYLMYLKRKRTKPENYPDLIMDEWKRRGYEPFDLKNPETYTQKIQWAEIYENDPRKTTYSDKVAVREWISETIGDEYLIKSLGVFSNVDDIDFDKLPDRFAIKLNNSSGFNIIVKDKSKINVKAIKRQLKKWMKIDYAFYGGFQPHYLGIEPKILIEEYLEDGSGELRDYKFMCFNGVVKYCWVDIGRFGKHCRNVYDPEWNLQPWTQSYPNYDGLVEKPENFEKMIEIARVLCQGFSHVRVDLYNVDGRIYFGEMTFSNGGGHSKFIPDGYDKSLGDEWIIK